MPLIITVDIKEFISSVASLQNVTGKKGTIAILANILIETGHNSITLTATDLEVGIKTTLPAEVKSEGSITLPARKMFEILRETNDDRIDIEVAENNWAKITTKSGSYNLAGADSEEYPAFPEFENDKLATISSDVLKEAIEKTVFSIAHDGESQFNLTAALLEKETRDDKNYIRFISSDGHRLSFMEREVDTNISNMVFEKTILIPRKGILEISKFCEKSDFIDMGFDDKQAVLKTENSLMIIRLMNGDFPDYKNILNAIEKKEYIQIDRLSFISAMKRINLFTEDLFSSVHFNFTDNKLILTSQNMDIGSGKEELPIEYSGENMTLGFNGKYFIETLQVMSSEKIKAYINSESSPCLITGDDDPGFMSVIMPMKI